MFPKRKSIHLAHIDYSDPRYVYFVTLCTYKNQLYFQHNEIAQYIADELMYRQDCSSEIVLFAYCIMPDHVHLLLRLDEEYRRSLQQWVSAFKRYIAQVIAVHFNIKPLWQKNFYEHIVRKDQSLENIAQYIACNPVRKNIVDDWQAYPYSKIYVERF